MGFLALTVGNIGENTYIYFDDVNKMAAVIDPGADAGVILELLEKKGMTVTHILLTHGHYDHTGAVEEIRGATGAAVMAHKDEENLLLNPRMSYAAAGPVKADGFLSDGDTVTVGENVLRVIHTPGHTAGSCCFHAEKEGVLFSGDTLFYESVGRYDFPTGNHNALMDSIKQKLYTLPDSTTVCPGHMGETSIRHEKAHNAFVR